jgi:hypothetical protein
MLVYTASTNKHADMEGIVNEYLFDCHNESAVNHVAVAEMVTNIDSEHGDNID